MNKKILIVIISTILIFSGLLASSIFLTRHFTAKAEDNIEQEQPEEPHEHTFGEWQVITVATCTEEGQEQRSCKCGGTETRAIAVTEHNFVETGVEGNECIGTKTKLRCEMCGEEHEITFLGIGHTFDYISLGGNDAERISATCTTPAYDKETCTRCGEIKLTKVQGSSALGHDYCEWVIDTEATCTTEGSRHKTCSRCEDVVTEIIPVDEENHEYTETVTEATCTETGYTTHTCSRCNKTYTDSESEALDHDYCEWVIDAEATCTTEGSRHKTCSRCEDVVTEIIPVDEENHIYQWNINTVATCSAEGSKTGTCSRCSNQVVETIPINSSKHTYGEAMVVTNSTCTEMGKSQKTCQDCGYVYTYNISLLTHVETDIDYLNNTFLCNSCNERYVLAKSDDLENCATLTGYTASGKKTSFLGNIRYYDISEIDKTLTNVYISNTYKNKPVKLTTADLLREFHATYIYVEDGVEIQNLAAFIFCESLQYISLPASARELNLDFTGCPSDLVVYYR